MFGFLKDKLKRVVKSISEKLEKKEVEPVEEKVEVPAAEQVAEKVEATVEEVAERIEAVEEVKPEIKKVEPEVVEPEVAEVRREVEKVVEEKPKKGFFKKIAEKFVKKVVEKKLSSEDVGPILEELKTGLIESDVAYDVAEKIRGDMMKSLVGREIKRGKEKEVVVEALKNSLLEILTVPEIDLENIAREKKPVVLVFLGFNGSGKTTSLAKVGNFLIGKGYSCVFAAADTFRAGSEEQLEEHAKKIGVKVVKHKYGADPAAVVFDAIEHAKASGINFVLADTAGRAHTNKNLMDQMKKIVKVNKPDVKILVVDSLTGNDALIQAKEFGEIGVDGVIFTKVDVNEKGGAILSVTHELKKPILFLGLGQEYKDFEKFDKEKFVNLIIGV
jgi:fused signal recognition particle receptor